MPSDDMDQDVTKILMARETCRRNALVDEDMVLFDDLLADDIVHVHTTGIVHDKPALIEHASKFLRFYDVERGPLDIRRLASDVAVMTGRMTNTVGKRGTDERLTVNAFVTQVWVLRSGRWQIASFHAVRQT